MNDKTNTGPIPSSARIASLDILRGFALLGILVMNIQGFAMIEAAYFNPSLHMDLNGVNWGVWAFSHMFADLKFMAIFSMLFGAGIIVLTQKRESDGKPALGLHFSRTFWLLVFGLIHAYLIWFGDILTAYAICAVLVVWFRRFSPRRLLVLGAAILLVAPLISLMVSFGLQNAPEDIRLEVVSEFTPSPKEILSQIEAFRGGFSSSLPLTMQTAFSMQTEAIPFYLFWRASGLMLIGMALFKIGVFSAERSRAFYNRMILIGLGVGLPLVLISVLTNSNANWDPLYSLLGTGALYNYIGSLGISAAYIGIVMRLVQSGKLSTLQSRLAAVGRMAFTNYILQSVICIALFYGFGLGLFGFVERWGQILIVLAIWAVQLTISPIWLRRFRFGPLEWAWRSLTYMRLQPMMR